MSIASSWDAEYRSGKYAGDSPLPFVTKIVRVLEDDEAVRRGTGLYIGCGNGRNFLPLLDHGFDLKGLDLSSEALRQIGERRPDIGSERLICGNFLSFENDGRPFDYLIALQVFQHGSETQIQNYFRRVAELLRRGGIFFLRVNSTSTQIARPHTVVEQNEFGGLTVRYNGGPKKGLLVHFFSKSEVEKLLGTEFQSITDLSEDTTYREPPESGSWSQWEGVWRRS